MDRRRFLKGSAFGTSAIAFALVKGAWAASLPASPQAAGTTPVALRAVRRSIEVNGKAATVFGLQQANGTPGISIREGSAFNVALRNETDQATVIHWHGLTPPFKSDGGGDTPLPLIAAGADRSFNFPVGTAGTHWMHAHTLQEQALLAAPLIVTSADDLRRDEQDVVVLLHDFSFTPAEEILRRLTKGSASKASMPMGNGQTMNPATPGSMPMPDMAKAGGSMARDINDIDYDAYLANDRTLDDPEIVSVEAGGRVRVRIINGATATVFTMDFGELEGTLTAVDGRDIEPIKGRRFPVAMGQRIDVRLALPREIRSFPILALREGARERTGVILRPTGAAVEKLSALARENGPIVDLSLEARLRALAPLKSRTADKAFDMALTGGMEGYQWGLATPAPILVSRGDRVEVAMRNTSMMAHPMHLHGHHFQVVAIDGRRFAGAMRDTAHIPPRRSVTIAVDADNPGDWPFHCHNLYHMAAGMMTRFGYVA